MRGLIEMAEYRQRTVSKQKKDKLRLPEYTTRTVVIWGLKEEEKSASFIKGFLSFLSLGCLHDRISVGGLISSFRYYFRSRENCENNDYQT